MVSFIISLVDLHLPYNSLQYFPVSKNSSNQFLLRNNFFPLKGSVMMNSVSRVLRSVEKGLHTALQKEEEFLPLETQLLQ